MDISILDDLLSYMSKIDSSQHSKKIVKQFLEENPNSTITQVVILKAIQKLYKDGYIDELEQNIPFSTQGTFTTYTISFDGLVFLSEGGYNLRSKKIQLEEQRLYDVEKSQFVQQKWIHHLTWIIAIGTAVAAIYYGFQIWHEIFPKVILKK